MKRLLLVLVLAGCGADPGLGPTGRIVNLHAPLDLAEAREMGCVVLGDKLGSSLGNLELLSGGFEQYFLPGDGGRIRIVTVAEAHDIQEDGSFELRFHNGSQKTQTRFEVDGDGQSFPGLIPDDEGWIEGRAPEFVFGLPVFEDLILQGRLESPQLTAVPRIEGEDLTMTGTLTGYVSAAQLHALIDEVLQVCATEQKVICDVLSALGEMPTHEAVFENLHGLLGGFDARIVDGNPDFCDPSAVRCNAASVCFRMEVEPATVARAGEPQ